MHKAYADLSSYAERRLLRPASNNGVEKGNPRNMFNQCKEDADMGDVS